jgi:hypothetical protein
MAQLRPSRLLVKVGHNRDLLPVNISNERRHAARRGRWTSRRDHDDAKY